MAADMPGQCGWCAGGLGDEGVLAIGVGGGTLLLADVLRGGSQRSLPAGAQGFGPYWWDGSPVDRWVVALGSSEGQPAKDCLSDGVGRVQPACCA